LYEVPRLLRQIERFGERTANNDALHARPEWLPFKKKQANRLGGGREPNTFESAGMAQDSARDSNNLAIHIKDGATRVTAVYRRVRLQKLASKGASDTAILNNPPADVSRGEGVRQTVWRSYHEHFVSYLEPVRVAQWGGFCSLGYRLEL
jgi:hypothetical protein